VTIEIRAEDSGDRMKSTISGEGAGGDPVTTKMKRTRRNGAAAAAALDRRNVFVVGVTAKNRAEFSQLAAASADTTWQDFSAGQEFLKAAGALGGGCVIVCEPLADIETLAIVSWLGQQRADLASIVISSQPTVKAAVECLKAGASDYLSLPLERSVFAAALRAVFEPSKERATRGTALARLKMTSKLSQRELQVLEGLLNGMSNKAVGVKLHISERTVEVHRSRIMRRLNVESFAELVRMSVRAGIGTE